MSVEAAASEGQTRSRLRWRCRRGMRELDVLLGRYLDRRYPTASDTEKRAFEAVLDLPDPELFGYLVSGEPVLDEALRVVLDQIRTQS